MRIYRPLQSASTPDELRPALIYFHGGAFYLCSVGECTYPPHSHCLCHVDTHNSVTATIARETGFIVISVE